MSHGVVAKGSDMSTSCPHKSGWLNAPPTPPPPPRVYVCVCVCGVASSISNKIFHGILQAIAAYQHVRWLSEILSTSNSAMGTFK